MAPTSENFPKRLPLLPLKDIVIFPQMILPVFVSEDICLRAVENALENGKFIFLSAFKCEKNSDPNVPELNCSTPAPFDVYDVGTVALIMRTRRLPDGRTKVLIQGLAKARLETLHQVEPFPQISVVQIEDPVPKETKPKSAEAEALSRTVREQIERLVSYGRVLSPDILLLMEDVFDPGRLADLIASNLGLKIKEAQKILATLSGLNRLKLVHQVLLREIEVHSMQVRIQSQAKEELHKNGREQFLREQLKAIKGELGEMDVKDELEELREKILSLQLPKEMLSEATKQLKRLERMNPESSEATITRTYLEWVVDLPWTVSSPSQLDLQFCQRVLDEDHYSLQKIKDRILEFIAVKKLNPDLKGPILCFVGPPGVGKTSLGRSIAKAIGRQFVRIALGGLRDEAEIRGHRRTYVGSQPGRIINAMKLAGVNNPVIMLDEIDKLASDFKGDPASALLEVLDPEQNHSFSDHYLGVAFDLSKVMFIANANRLDTIPVALRDRLEVIELGGYTDEEKIEIARNYLIPKVTENSGLSKQLVSIPDPVISFLVQHYTRESGLRHLEKQVSTVLRKIARQVAENDEKGIERKLVKVNQKLIKDFLGGEIYLGSDHDTQNPRCGVSVGLAYTQYGGELLTIECNLLPGKGQLTLTGQLGEVMKESAQTALSYVKNRAQQLGIDSTLLSQFDVHLHFPAGAVPKDGPSAGIALVASLVSGLTGRNLRQDVAMTGEVTLFGQVLPIGGLKEKLLAACRHGIKTVLIPERNRSALMEIPVSVKRKLDIQLVKHVTEVLDICLTGADSELQPGRAKATAEDLDFRKTPPEAPSEAPALSALAVKS
jgi:ATP-dependent Lon protease